MRYWPLTAVLLAFWLGRETGAQDREGKKDGYFDAISAETIELRGKASVVLDGTGLRMTSADKRALELKPTGLQLKQDGKVRCVVAIDDDATAIALLGSDGKPRITLAESGPNCAISISSPKDTESTMITPKGVDK